MFGSVASPAFFSQTAAFSRYSSAFADIVRSRGRHGKTMNLAKSSAPLFYRNWNWVRMKAGPSKRAEMTSDHVGWLVRQILHNSLTSSTREKSERPPPHSP